MIIRPLFDRIAPPKLFLSPDIQPLPGGAFDVVHGPDGVDAGEIPLEFGPDDGPPVIPAPAAPSEPAPESQPDTTGGDRPRDDKGRFLPKRAEEPFPEIPASKPEGDAAPEVKPTPEATAPQPETPPKAPEPKPATPTPEPEQNPKEQPKDERFKDVDDIQPKETASEKTRNDFKVLKGIAKEERTKRFELETKLAELEKKVTAPAELPADAKAKLDDYDRLSRFEKAFLLENEPKSRAAYAEKLGGVEKKILDVLQKDPRFQMPASKAEELVKAGFDTAEGQNIRNWILSTIRNKVGTEAEIEVAMMFRERGDVVKARQTEIEGLRQDMTGYLEQRKKAENDEFNNWGAEADKTLGEVTKDHDWINYMGLPENPTKEQQDAKAAHDARVNELVPKFQEMVKSVYLRNPKATAETVFKAFLADHLQGQLATERDKLTKANERIAELEKKVGGVRQVTQISHADAAPKGKVPNAVNMIAGEKEVDLEDSFSEWERERGAKGNQ